MGAPAAAGNLPLRPQVPPQALPGAPPAQAKPSRWQIILAYGVMLAPTVAKICVFAVSMVFAGIAIAKVTAPPTTIAAAASVGTLVGVMALSAALALGFTLLIIWIIPSDPDDSGP